MEKQINPYTSGKRIIELDFFRGLAILLMFFHHFIYDLRHVFGLDVLAFQDTLWFMDWFRPIILLLFLSVAGISCVFSRNNFRRASIVLAFALTLTLFMEAVSFWSQSGFHIYFNVFHLVAVGIFLYAGLDCWEQYLMGRYAAETMYDEKRSRISKLFSLGLIIGALYILFLGASVVKTNPISHNALLILGLYAVDVPGMADYLPLLPWLGFFLGGCAIGRLFYKARKSLCSTAFTERAAVFGKPLLFLGRHPLTVYALHQPIFIGLIGFILLLMGKWRI